MADKEKCQRFEQVIMPHLDAAYNLARWLLRNDEDAEEAVQEAYLRAYRFFDSFRGEDGKAWLLAIVRNACYTLRSQNMSAALREEFDEEAILPDGVAAGSENGFCCDPAELVAKNADRATVNRAIEKLPVVFREILVMREIEGLSYKEIAKIADIPLGTAMSRLARGRQLLQEALAAHLKKESPT